VSPEDNDCHDALESLTKNAGRVGVTIFVALVTLPPAVFGAISST